MMCGLHLGLESLSYLLRQWWLFCPNTSLKNSDAKKEPGLDLYPKVMKLPCIQRARLAVKGGLRRACIPELLRWFLVGVYLAPTHSRSQGVPRAWMCLRMCRAGGLSSGLRPSNLLRGKP